MTEEKDIYFVDEKLPDKRGKKLTKEDRRNWFWGIVSLMKKPEECNDEELDVQKMYKRILIF